MQNMVVISSNLRQNTRQIDSTLANINQISDSLASADIKKTLTKADQAVSRLNTIMYKINEGSGTAGQLVNNDTLYNNLESSSRRLNRLLEDLQHNPGRYVHFSIFGKNKEKEN